MKKSFALFLAFVMTMVMIPVTYANADEVQEQAIDVIIAYYSENGEVEQDIQSIVVDYGTTYGQLYEMIDYSDYVHNKEVTLTGWEGSWYDENEVITSDITEVWMEAEYEENLVEVQYSYYDEETIEQMNHKIVVCDNDITYRELIESINLDALKHSAELGFVDWEVQDDFVDLDTVVDTDWIVIQAQYEKNVVTFEYYYYDENLEYQLYSESIICENAVTYNDIIEEYLPANLNHYEDLDFAEWDIVFDGVDLEEEVGAYGWISCEAIYNNAVVEAYAFYRDANYEYQMKEFLFAADVETTYGELIEQIKAETVFPDISSIEGWDYGVSEEMLSEAIGSGVVWLYIQPIYADTFVTVYVEYLNEEGIYDSELSVISAKKGTTYQELYDSLELDIEHHPDYRFRDWNIILDEGIVMSDVIDAEGGFMDLVAEYEVYPINYVYTYLTKNNETKTVEESVLVSVGSNIMDYFEILVLPEDASETVTEGWYLDGWYETVDIYSTEVHGAVKYKDTTPVFVYLDYINDEKELESGLEAIYFESTEDLDVIKEKTVEIFKDIHGLDFVSAEWLMDDFEVMEFEDGYYYGPSCYFYATYTQAVLYLQYPDETEEKEIIDADTVYVLPKQYKGYDVEWTILSMNQTESGLAGGTEIIVETPFTIAMATFVDGNVVIEPEEPDSENPSESEEADSEEPSESEEADSEEPSESEEADSEEPSEGEEADSEEPSESEEADSEEPSESEEADSEEPSESEEADSEEPSEGEEASSEEPSESEEADSEEPSEGEEASSEEPSESEEADSEEASESEENAVGEIPTSDNTNVLLWISILGIGVGAFAGVVFMRKRSI